MLPIEYQVLGYMDSKERYICYLRRFFGRLTESEKIKVGKITKEENIEFWLKNRCCLIVALTGEGLVSVVVTMQEGNLCFPMAATDGKFRGRGIYGKSKELLLSNCLKEPECPAKTLVTMTGSRAVEAVSRRLGFIDCGDGVFTFDRMTRIGLRA